MTETRSSPRQSREAWKYGLIGGVASIPLTIGLYWLSGMGNEFSSSMVFFGGILAGYLAKRSSTEAGSAGIRGGVVGGLPGLAWILPALSDTAAGFDGVWSSPLLASVFVVSFGLVVLAISGLVGLIGGKIGGWLSGVIDRQQTSGVGS